MDRDEAILRELNLYPLWTSRAVTGEPIAEIVTSQAEPNAVMAALPAPLATETMTEMDPAYSAYVARESEREEDGSSVASPAAFSVATTWPELKTQVRGCQRCDLRGTCTQTVFGVGAERADWMFIGEAPGMEEDQSGVPFVGDAGKLLDNMLAAIKLNRSQQVYITNVVKCRPAEQASPDAEQIQRCMPYLARQIESIQPKVIVALGKVAAQALLGEVAPLDELRGVLHEYCGIPVVVSYHPAYLLRRPNAKAQAWQDLCFAVDVMQQVE